MEKLFQIALILIAGSSVAIADGIIKQSAFKTHNFWVALKNPLMIWAVVLYILQVVIFTYIFVKRWELGIVGLMQMVLYAAIVIFLGVFFFNEKMSITQGIGMGLALIGVLFMNS